MGLRLCPYRAALLPGGLLLLLLLADPAVPGGRPPPVVLGEAGVLSWVGSLVRRAGPGAGGAIFQVYICCKHGVGKRMTVLSSGSVRPSPAILGAGVVNLLSPSHVDCGGEWEGYREVAHRSARPRQSEALPCLALSPYLSWKDRGPLAPLLRAGGG